MEAFYVISLFDMIFSCQLDKLRNKKYKIADQYRALPGFYC